MLDDLYDKNSKYNNILKRIDKKFSLSEGILITTKLYLTNNAFYYYLCILFRFIHILLLCGNYSNFINSKSKSQSFHKYLKLMTMYNLFKQSNFSFIFYCLIILILFILIIIKITAILCTFRKIRNYDYNNKWIIPSKFQIILDHIIFLFYPYIIELFSFPFYIYFFPNKFVIQIDIQKQKGIIILFIIINTLLIIVYNIYNYILIICSNKIYTITIFEINLKIRDSNSIFSPTIAYKCSNISFYIIIFFQNFPFFIFYLDAINNKMFKIIIKVAFSLILLTVILIFFLNQMNNFNYFNSRNSFINILFFLCFYFIIIDLIVYKLGYEIVTQLNLVIYLIIKILLSYITNLLFILKNEKCLEKKLLEFLFEEKIDKIQKNFFNCFHLLHYKMLMIKEELKVNKVLYLVKLLNEHTNNCNKISCNCKLIKIFLKSANIGKITNQEDLNNYTSQLLIILNYLFECSFIDMNFFNSFDLSILLAEHYCDLRNNPIMAFSIINTFLLKQKNRLTKIQMIHIYELSQKYVYYMVAKMEKNIEMEIIKNKIDLLIIKNQKDAFKTYYYNLIIANKIKQFFLNYINNLLRILKYKSIFEDSLSFTFDENNEIISAKINFFQQNIKIDKIDVNTKKKQEIKNYGSNLYNVINELKRGQFYYKEIINSINKIQRIKAVPIVILFKYFLFFDIFENGKIPEQIVNKLYELLINKSGLSNNIITKKEYSILKRRYNEEKNKVNSKAFILVEFKKDLRIKYFSEDEALKLGFKQKDIINQKIDLLMPNEFCKSHNNTIKELIIGRQIKYNINKQSFYFDKTNSILYPTKFEGALIYNISKSLIEMIKSEFIFENEYRFMLDNNFELLANSKNFEEEYYLNQKILYFYHINFLDILKLNSEKIKEKFKEEFQKIQNQNIIRQIKTQEYFVPQLYIPKREKINGLMNSNYLKNSKKNILLKLLNANNKNEANEEKINSEHDDEKEKFKEDNFEGSINDLFIKPREVVFHKYYNFIINKGNFIENLGKELIKIPDNDLIKENKKDMHNLIIESKNLIYKLLEKQELLTHFLRISIRFSFYYDKLFYFVTITDEKKLYLKISKYFNFENGYIDAKKQELNSSKKDKNILIPFNNNYSKISRNIDNKNLYLKNKIKEKDNDQTAKRESINSEQKDNNEYEILNKMKETKEKINKNKFIYIIKTILTIIIIFILILNFILIIFQIDLYNKMELILLAYYYNLFTKNLLLGVQSIIMYIYYDFIVRHYFFDIETNYYILYSLTSNLKNKYHNFTSYFFNYNLAIGRDLNLFFKRRNFLKLRGFWQEIQYKSKYSSELDFTIYNIISYNPKELLTLENYRDFENFLFFSEKTEDHIKINCRFVKILYYLCNNYEFTYKKIFKEIQDSIYDSYKHISNSRMKLSIILDVIIFISLIIFFITVIVYLYFSNIIIIKNIIFLFLDDHYAKNKLKNTNLISLKIMEFQNIINDFNLQLLKKYSKNIDKLNKHKYKNSDSLDDNNIISNIDELQKSSSNISESNIESNIGNKKQINTKKNTNKKLLKGETINSNKNNIFKSKLNTNNSSHNYLMDSNSQYFKDKLNNNYNNINNDILSIKNNNLINFKKKISKENINENINNNMPNEKESQDEEIIQDAILNKSNIIIILMIKICILIILIFIFLVIIYYWFKLDFFITFNKMSKNYFNDLTIFTERYMQVYYYFNTLRCLMIFPDGEKKTEFENIMENMNKYSDEENEKLNKIFSYNIKDYPEVNKLFKAIKYSQNNSTDVIKNAICKDQHENCGLYLDSEYNIFKSGLDFTFKTTMTQINNIYKDYKNLGNKKDIQELKTKIVDNKNNGFFDIGISLNYFYVYIEQAIFSSFEQDENAFINYFRYVNTLLNLVSIIHSIFIFVFINIFIFISISKFTEPIKVSAYRISCTFYYIKKYNLFGKIYREY